MSDLSTFLLPYLEAAFYILLFVTPAINIILITDHTIRHHTQRWNKFALVLNWIVAGLFIASFLLWSQSTPSQLDFLKLTSLTYFGFGLIYYSSLLMALVGEIQLHTDKSLKSNK